MFIIIWYAVISSLLLLPTLASKGADGKLYRDAFSEISLMLDGKQTLSLKRAVFLVEWAYLDGKPDYMAFCREINSTAQAIGKFIADNNLSKMKTGKNAALFEYFSTPSPLNDFRPFVYDFDDIMGKKDLTKLFVTKLMRTHSGQCRSLPLYYKILANEIGAEAYIAYAPMHSFIRHRSEEGDRWINVELTNSSLPREIFIIESSGITKTAVEKGTYMKPCGDREVVINLLTDLLANYMRQYGYANEFFEDGINQVLKYDPKNLRALLIKYNCIRETVMAHQKAMEEKGLAADDYLIHLKKSYEDLNQRIVNSGHTDISKEQYDKWMKEIYDEKQRRNAAK